MPQDPIKLYIRFLIGSAAVLLLSTSAAIAASIENRDAQDRTVTIVEGSAQKDHVLKPNAVLEGVCKSGCTVRIDGNDVSPYELDGSETTSIEGGDLYAEGQGPLVSPRPGASSQPLTPGPTP